MDSNRFTSQWAAKKIGADSRAPRLQFHGFGFFIDFVAGEAALTAAVPHLYMIVGPFVTIKHLMPSEFTVEFAPHGKAIVYREGQRTFAFESVTRDKRVEVDFGHSYDPSSFGGGAYDYGPTTTEEQRRIAPRIIHWLQAAGYKVDAAGQHDDRWLPSRYKQ